MALRAGRGLMIRVINSGMRNSWKSSFPRTVTYNSETKPRKHIPRTEARRFDTDNRPAQMQVDSLEDISDESLTNIASDILSKASSKDIMVKVVNVHVVKTFVKELLLAGWSLEMLKTVFISCPTFLTQPRQKTLYILELLKAYGFTIEQTAMVMSSGVMVGQTDTSFSGSMSALMKIGIKDQQLQRFVSMFPDVLHINPKSIERRVTDLKGLFKSDDIIPLIFTSPNILVDKWAIIHKKFHCVFTVMGIKQRQMVSSRLFTYSLEHITIRHKFVERAGLYSRPREKDEYLRRTNPKLKEILDTSDEHFARMFGDMSIQDYKAFYNMMKKEMELKDAEYNSDDESDTEY